MTETGGFAELAVVRRSGMVESRHFGSLVALAPDGTPLLRLGEVDAVTLPRSTAKPLQALACLRAGAPLPGAELAISAGSHTGRDEHVSAVRGILARAGLDEKALGCPADRPEDEATFDRGTGAHRHPPQPHPDELFGQARRDAARLRRQRLAGD